MSNVLLAVCPATPSGATEQPMRCDACGHRVLDPRTHVEECVERQLALFTAGRRAG